jgi:anaerobic ribonucleoside-triphosphate reductase activating protein
MSTKIILIADDRAAPKSWPENRDILHLARRSNHCTVLGPETRAVLWVQGCRFRCPGCVAPETQPLRGGQEVDVASLAEELAHLPEIEGVTFSGGEPMAQAAALVNLVDSIRRKRDLSFMSYTGYTLEHLLRRGSAAQKALVARLDILVDGPYIAARHTDLRWRGSDNQQVHFLSPRYRHLAAQANERGYQLECEHSADGTFHWMGIPPKGFRERLERNMLARGIVLRVTEGCHE